MGVGKAIYIRSVSMINPSKRKKKYAKYVEDITLNDQSMEDYLKEKPDVIQYIV